MKNNWLDRRKVRAKAASYMNTLSRGSLFGLGWVTFVVTLEDGPFSVLMERTSQNDEWRMTRCHRGDLVFIP